MNEETKDALWASQNTSQTRRSVDTEPKPRHSQEYVLSIIKPFLEALPGNVTVEDILEDLNERG